MVVHFARTTLQPDKIPHKSGAGSNRVSLDGRAFAQALRITCLRVALFSHIQNQLVQSQRSGKQADVDYLITTINDNSYTNC